jgi:hypothetical protein
VSESWWFVAATSAVGLIVAASSAYVLEQLKQFAREQSEKALQDYKHGYDRVLAAVNTQQQSRLQEFNLFTQRQHLVYARIYRLYRIAADYYAATSGFTQTPDFLTWTHHEARAFMERAKLDPRRPELAAILEGYESGSVKHAARSMEGVYARHRERLAQTAFLRAKSYEAVEELFLSDDARAAVTATRVAIAAYAVRLGDENVDRQDFEGYRQGMLIATADLQRALRSELQRGQTALRADVPDPSQ